MLHRIECDQIAMGMYVHAFDGSWFHHPFWRASFLITDGETLEKIRWSSLNAVIIDDEKGIGLRPIGTVQPAPSAPSAALAPISPIAKAAVARLRRPATPHQVHPQRPRQSDREVDRARAVIARGKQMVMRLFDDARMGTLNYSTELSGLVDDIAMSLERSRLTLINIARLKSRDEYTYLHSVAVCALMVNFARQLGLDEDKVHDLGVAGLLHDVGKMRVPLDILNKSGSLSDEEFVAIKSHTTAGRDLLDLCDDVPPVARDVALHHHERVDGNGYPFGLSGEALSMAARMGAICDIYDALTSDRVYKQAWQPGEAITRMAGWEGHLDGDLLFRFMQSITLFPPGMLVRLRSNRLAIILPNGRRGSRAKARAFYSALDHDYIGPRDIALGDALSDDQVVSREDPLHWAITDWESLQSDLLAGRYRAESRRQKAA